MFIILLLNEKERTKSVCLQLLAFYLKKLWTDVRERSQW